MAVPILPIVLIGGGLLAIAAMQRKSSPTTTTFVLDDNMEPHLRNNVLAALVDEPNPARLEAFAAAIESGYPISAQQLRLRAATLRGSAPPKSQPQPAPQPVQPALPQPAPKPMPSGPQPTAPAFSGIDANIPEPTRTQVLQMAQGAGQGNDIASLEAFANSLASQYPKAAYMLRYRAWILRGMRGSPPIPDYPGPLPIEPILPASAPVQPAPAPQPQPPVAPQPAPQPAPAPRGPQPTHPAFTDIDANIPEPTRTQVLQMAMGAGTQGNDPATLDAFAASLAATYPKAAYMLRTRAWILRGMKGPAPVLETPQPQPAPFVQPGPTPFRPPGVEPLPVGPTPWPGPWFRTSLVETGKRYRATIPLPTLKGLSLESLAATAGVLDLIVWPSGASLPADWPKDDSLAYGPLVTHVEGTWTRSSTPVPEGVSVWGREAASKALPTPSPMPLPSVPPAIPLPPVPPVQPAPQPIPLPPAPQPLPPVQPSPPVPLPVPSIPGFSGIPALDAGMPPEVASAVIQSLTTASDPVELETFAYTLAGKYPMAAALLNAKAKALRAMQPPAPAPTPPAPLPPIVPPAPAPPAPAPAALYPIGGDITRTGRNEKRPQGQYPFLRIRSDDSLAPITISKIATGTEANFKMLNKLNPHRAPRGQWTDLGPNDCLNVPWEWAPKLKAAGYLIEQDPGAVPQAA